MTTSTQNTMEDNFTQVNEGKVISKVDVDVGVENINKNDGLKNKVDIDKLVSVQNVEQTQTNENTSLLQINVDHTFSTILKKKRSVKQRNVRTKGEHNPNDHNDTENYYCGCGKHWTLNGLGIIKK